MQLRYTFDKIETEEQAYWFGYLMADGYNHISGKMIQFTQAEQDKEMVYKFKEFMDGGNICITRFPKDDPRMDLYMFSVSNRDLCKNLTNLGCHNKKSLDMIMPDIPEGLFWHFLRGYFDGDGCIYCKLRKPDNAIVLECPIVCSNEFAKSLIKILNFYDIKTYSQKLGKNKLCTTIKISGVLKGSKFLSLLYNNSTIYSPRKWDKFMSFCKLLEECESNHKNTKEAINTLKNYGFITQ